ncbi:MAG: serine/threonine transporter SstT [Erysipelotrichaceae bacterium]|nr:serine/threonine transporter SstT [Erysipelotrichaceae bacterium]
MKGIIKKYTETSLIIRILIGLIIGAVLGLACPNLTGFAIPGDIFVGALKAIAPVLVAVLVCSSVAKAGEGIGSRFKTVIILYLATTLIASTFAVFSAKLFPVKLKLVAAATDVTPPDGLAGIFKNLLTGMVQNPIKAVAEANYLAILFWAIIIGLALKLLGSKATVDVIATLSEALSKVVGWVIQFAPFGVMGIMFTNISTNGLVVFVDYGKLILLLVGTMLFTSLVINPILVAVLLKKNPYPLVFKCIKTSGVPAFFTRSSAANIPVNMALCEELGLDKDFYSVSIPLGSTINMDGAASVITIMSLTAANTLGINVPLPLAIVLSIVATLGACGASGVAGGSLLLIPMACSLLGIGQDVAMQVVAVGFIIGVIQDSVETALNSSGDVIFTATAEFYERAKKEKAAK